MDETTFLLPHERAGQIQEQEMHHQQQQQQQREGYGASSTRRPTMTLATESLSSILASHTRNVSSNVEEDEEQQDQEQGQQQQQEEESTWTSTPTSRFTHLLSRIDCIEIDLWHERIRDYEAAELGQISCAELGLAAGTTAAAAVEEGVVVVDEDEGERERLSRVDTCVASAGGSRDEGVVTVKKGKGKRGSSDGGRFREVWVECIVGVIEWRQE
jgi:hypothetical protein